MDTSHLPAEAPTGRAGAGASLRAQAWLTKKTQRSKERLKDWCGVGRVPGGYWLKDPQFYNLETIVNRNVFLKIATKMVSMWNNTDVKYVK